MPDPDTGDRTPRGPASPAPSLPSYPGGRPADAAPAAVAPGGVARPGTGSDTGTGPDTGPGTGSASGSGPGVDGGTATGPWPTVRLPSARAVLLRRVAAGLGLVYGYAVYAIATDVLSRADHLLAAVVVGGVLNLVGVVLLWVYSTRTPHRVAPGRGPGMGLARDRATARTVLRSGGTPDGEQRRLIAVDVLADAPLPLVTGAVFVLLGPLVLAAVNDSGPLAPLGPVTAALVLLVLAGLAWRTRSAHALHRAADRRHTVPRFEGSGSPWRPWP